MQTVCDAIHGHQHALLFMCELVYSTTLLPLKKNKANSATRKNTFSIRNTHRYYVRRRSKTVNKACIIINATDCQFFSMLFVTYTKSPFDWVEGRIQSAFYWQTTPGKHKHQQLLHNHGNTGVTHNERHMRKAKLFFVLKVFMAALR